MSSIVDKLFDKTIPGLGKALDLQLRRSEAIISNIANTETPGYRAVDLNFGSELKRAFDRQESVLKKTNPRHMDLSTESSAHLMPDLTGATKPDGNNVDLDIQLGKLNQTAGKYSIAARLVQKKLRIMRTAIRFAMR
ncbi:MAG: flagellar basal body rod protein FlgB [Candidatus Dadabacteria bacterium]|nr:MAG: flagellar basal body rod protein FlgB [Candidatus Dadabacteria bacterium]